MKTMEMENRIKQTITVAIVLAVSPYGGLGICGRFNHVAAEEGRRFAHSDSDSRYVHHIDLYDIQNRKITPDSDQPYSPKNTCGRCHDYLSISHGWHFNAFRSHVVRSGEVEGATGDYLPDDGRPGEPWIWTDERTGTQLPLSYRDWPGRFNPVAIGIDEWQMTRQFGSRLPGGGAGSEEERLASKSRVKAGPEAEADSQTESAEPAKASRWVFSGDLEVDCMVCHATSGAYDFELRRDTIRDENFAWAPTAAMRLGRIDGSVARISEGADPNDQFVQAKIPKVVYDARRFHPDGTVFMDLVRHVENNACYQCHSQRTISPAGGVEERWVHDQDVHLRAGMKCTDCHRNGIDHQITRGFEGEPQSWAQTPMTTLSCAGCHLGTDFYLDEEAAEASLAQRDIRNRPGRMGAPLPKHEGLPPIHFEKLTCTACHSGPVPTETALRLMTSLSHELGEKAHRIGSELPSLHGPLFVPSAGSTEQDGADSNLASRTTVARGMWPAYWGEIRDGNVQPLPPEKVYTATRKTLRVRRGFIQEVSQVEPSAKELVEILGEDRAKIPATERSAKEREMVAAFQLEAGVERFNERVAASLEAIEKEFGIDQAVYVSTGIVYARSEQGDAPALAEISVQNPEATGMVSWPLVHNVRPSGWSLGVTGCLECHADDGSIFASTVAATGPAPLPGVPVTMASLQGITESDRLLWNQMFVGRAAYKVLIAISLTVLAAIMLLGLARTIRRLLPGGDSRSRGTA